jgi:hypothetical protein
MLSTYIGAYEIHGSDVDMHLSRIVYMVSNGLSLEDGHLLGIPDSRYHFNIVYILYAIPSELFGLSPATVWRRSGAFLMLMQWTAVFFLAWHICKHWFKDRFNIVLFASLTTLFAMVYLNALYATAVYPNEVVRLWLILVVVGLSFYELQQKSSVVIALAAGFLASVTHPTYAFVAGIYVALAGLITLVLNRTEAARIKSRIFFYGSVSAALLLGPAITALFPNRMSDTAFRIAEFSTISWGPLAMKKPGSFLFESIPLTVLFIVGTFGLLYLVYQLWKQRQQWAVAFVLVALYPLVVYNPLLLTALHHVFPYWFIDRFATLNVLSPISVPLGVYAAARLTWPKITQVGFGSLNKETKAAYVWLVGGCLVLIACAATAPRADLMQFRQLNKDSYADIVRIQTQLGGILHSNKMVVTDTAGSYFIPAIVPVRVLAVPDSHGALPSDLANRLKCQTHIMQHFNYQDLKAVNANYVAIPAKWAGGPALKAVADKASHLRQTVSNEDFYVYEFLQTPPTEPAAKPYQPCIEYQKTENNPVSRNY